MLKKIDYRLLFELDNNARQSCGEIASKIVTSRQVVGNHLNMIVKEGYIIKFLTILDLSKLGLILHKVYIRLVRTSAEDELQILDFLKNHQNVAWLVRIEGIYDLAFALHTKDMIELSKILLEIENRFGGFISEKIVNRVLTGEFFHRDYFLPGQKSGLRKTMVFQSLEKEYALDEIDYKILAALCRNARVTSVDMAQKIPITADAIGKRIKNLEKAGIIKNYIIVINDSKLNQLHYKVLLKISHFTEDVERKFIEFCRQHANITFYNKIIGVWDLEIDLEVHKSEDFREIMRLIKTEFADFIREYFPISIYDILKFDFLPMHDF